MEITDCTCGHAEEDHGDNGTCLEKGCKCAGYEKDSD